MWLERAKWYGHIGWVVLEEASHKTFTLFNTITTRWFKMPQKTRWYHTWNRWNLWRGQQWSLSKDREVGYVRPLEKLEQQSSKDQVASYTTFFWGTLLLTTANVPTMLYMTSPGRLRPAKSFSSYSVEYALETSEYCSVSYPQSCFFLH